MIAACSTWLSLLMILSADPVQPRFSLSSLSELRGRPPPITLSEVDNLVFLYSFTYMLICFACILIFGWNLGHLRQGDWRWPTCIPPPIALWEGGGGLKLDQATQTLTRQINKNHFHLYLSHFFAYLDTFLHRYIATLHIRYWWPFDWSQYV